jgi:hypothetical protein
MSDEAAITIHGQQLTAEEAHIVRMAVDTFRAVMSQGMQEKDKGVLAAMTAPYVEALNSVQRQLNTGPGSRVR